MYTATGTAAQNAQNRVNQFGQAASNSSKQATAFGGSIAKLTQSMVLFSVLLPLVRLPQTVIRSFQEFVQVGEEWQTSIRGIAAMAGTTTESFQQLDYGLQNLTNTYHLTNEEVGTSVKRIASTLDVLDRSSEATNGLTQAQNNLNDTMALTNSIAKLSRAAFTDMDSATSVMFTTLATGRLNLSQVNTAMEDIFRTVQVGNTTLGQFNSAAQRFMPFWEDWIQSTPDATDKLGRLNDVMTAYAAASMQVGSQRAGTGLGQLAQSLTKMGQPQLEVIQRMEAIRRRQGLGEEFNITPQAMYSLQEQGGQGGIVELFTRLHNVLGQGSPIVEAYTKKLVALKKVGGPGQPTIEAARASSARQLEQLFIGSRTGMAVFEAVTAGMGTPGGGKLAQLTAEKAQATGMEAAYNLWLTDPKEAANAVRSAYETIQINVFESLQKDFVNINAGLARTLTNITLGIQGGAGGEGLFSRLQFIFGSLGDAFSKWYSSGGREQTINFAYTLGKDLSAGLAQFFSGGQGQSAVADAATEFTKAFVNGIKQNLPQMLTSMLSSSVIRAIMTFALLRGIPGVGTIPAAAGGFASTALPSGGPGGTMIGAGIAGLLGIRALASMTKWIANIGKTPVAPGAGGAAAGAGAAVTAAGGAAAGVPGGAAAIAAATGVSVATASRWLAGTSIPSAANAAKLQAMASAASKSPGLFSRLGLSGKAGLALSVLSGGLGLASALTGPEQGRGRAIGEAIGSTVGGVGGWLGGLALAGGTGGLGAFLAPALALGGGWAGGQVGGWLGEQLTGGPQMARATGTGLGPGTTAADDLATVFMAGLNGSDATAQLEQINRKMDVKPLGGTAIPRPGVPGIAGTGGGDLTAGFTSQFGDKTLTPAQANAACGPAAVAFFAKAYGRMPTLAEAYNLQSQLQGADIAATGGSNLVQMGKAIAQLGAPAGEVYQGANVDWGRLAENAKAGIPGIVNVGPSGAFPGHFFQIGGYDPTTNKFNVGPSGTELLKGGAPWMTPQQMNAFGPLAGAIYGTAVPPPKGAGNITPNAQVGSGRTDFLATMIPLAKQLETWTGIPWQVTTAIAANESTYGSSNLATTHRNYFGMQGPFAGIPGGDRWAQYGSASESVTAFGRLISQDDRYAKAYAQRNNPSAMVQSLKDAGYIKDEPGFPAQAWVSQVQDIMKGVLPSGAGTGMGPGGGGNIFSINTLIGSVTLGGTATQEDADTLAAMIANSLEELTTTSGGGTTGQNKIFNQ
jgi:hypothetical protein